MEDKVSERVFWSGHREAEIRTSCSGGEPVEMANRLVNVELQ